MAPLQSPVLRAAVRAPWYVRAAAPCATAALLLAALAGCGGGGSDDGTSTSTGSTSGGTTATAAAARYTEGTLNGFGSIIVNGVRFDDSAATVTDDNGGLRSASHLKLGMRVSVDSGAVDAAGNARASAVRFGSEIVGPVASVDAASGRLVVLGQTVEVTSTTVFDDSLATGLGAVALGAVVEVHGLPDSTTGRFVATRIEGASSATSYKLRGTVAGLDGTAKTFQIGAATIAYGSATNVPTTLANGSAVRVLLGITPVSGVWQATSLGSGTRSKLADSTSAHLRGKISTFTSSASFVVNGMAVDARAASFPDGTTGLAAGVEVEVEGTVSNGVLVATKVEIESRHSSDDSRKFDLRGAITSIDTTARTFVVKGVTVGYGGTVTYDKGTEAGLVVGAKVRVTGAVGSTRSQVIATRIRFDS